MNGPPDIGAWMGGARFQHGLQRFPEGQFVVFNLTGGQNGDDPLAHACEYQVWRAPVLLDLDAAPLEE